MERKSTSQKNPWNTLKAELKAKFTLYVDTFKIKEHNTDIPHEDCSQ